MNSLLLKSEAKKIFEGTKPGFEGNIKADFIEMGFESTERIELNQIGFTKGNGGALEIYVRQLRVRRAISPLLHTTS